MKSQINMRYDIVKHDSLNFGWASSRKLVLRSSKTAKAKEKP